MTDEIKFPEGKFYTCDDDPERLTHDEPWSAIEECLENNMEPGMPVAEVEQMCRDIGPLTVVAYVETKISDSLIESWAGDLKESLYEMFNDEHGDPNEGTELPEDSDKILLEAVTKIIRAMDVWSCEPAGTVELTGEQVLEMAKKERPDWFEEVEP